MKKTVKAIYIIVVALIVFMGALMILEGAERNARMHTQALEEKPAGTNENPIEKLFDDEEGSAI